MWQICLSCMRIGDLDLQTLAMVELARPVVACDVRNLARGIYIIIIIMKP